MSDLHDLVRHYQDAVEGVSILDLVPARWLHVTMLSIAFVDQVDANQKPALVSELRRRLVEFDPPRVTFQKPRIVTKAVYLRADPLDRLEEIPLAMHEAVAAVLPETFTRNRPQPGSFKPHLSFAYVNSDGPDEPIRAALPDVEPESVTVTFVAAYLVELSRDHGMWEWTLVARVPFRA
jgi:hypothetical protein